MLSNLILACGLACSVGSAAPLSASREAFSTETEEYNPNTIYQKVPKYQSNVVNSADDLIFGNIYRFYFYDKNDNPFFTYNISEVWFDYVNYLLTENYDSFGIDESGFNIYEGHNNRVDITLIEYDIEIFISTTDLRVDSDVFFNLNYDFTYVYGDYNDLYFDIIYNENCVSLSDVPFLWQFLYETDYQEYEYIAIGGTGKKSNLYRLIYDFYYGIFSDSDLSSLNTDYNMPFDSWICHSLTIITLLVLIFCAFLLLRWVFRIVSGLVLLKH